MSDDLHDHDRGLAHDLALVENRLRDRRRLLGLLATGGVVAGVAGAAAAQSRGGRMPGRQAPTTTGTTTTTTTTGTTSSACVADPTETNGPYPADGTNSVNGTISNVLATSGIVRSDIRSSFGISTNTAAGVPLVLTIKLVNTNASCAVLAGYAIYIWHCTREGAYSLYSSGIQNENYLRGVQVTDSSGQVTFTTVFPGCYSGRYPHIHFEVFPSLAVATGKSNAVLTSQFAMPRDVASAVYSGATGYSASVANLAKVTTSSDGVFGDNTAAQIAAMTPTLAGSVANGFTGSVVVGVAR